MLEEGLSARDEFDGSSSKSVERGRVRASEGVEGWRACFRCLNGKGSSFEKLAGAMERGGSRLMGREKEELKNGARRAFEGVKEGEGSPFSNPLVVKSIVCIISPWLLGRLEGPTIFCSSVLVPSL